jgi:branched-chain amino acid transport system permease protein
MKRLAGFYMLAAVFVLTGLIFPDNYYVTVVGVTVCTNAVLAVSLNLLMGYAGQISLGHAAFFGLGAYTSAILTTNYGINPWLAMLAGLGISGTMAFVLARPILKLKGHYLAMATLGMGIIIHIFFVQADWLTGGPDGLSSIPEISIAGWPINTDLRWYYVFGTLMLFSTWVSLNIIDSRPGRALAAVHGSEVAAQMTGVDTASVKAQIFVVSALLASVAGSLFAHQQAFVSPESFSFFFSIELVTMVVLGGLASTFGALFGAILLSILPEFLLVFEDFEVLIYGAILMVIMIFLPDGLFVSGSRLVTQLMKKREAAN